jgi:RIO kinase 2
MVGSRNADDWTVARLSGQPLDRVRFAIGKLNEKGLVTRIGMNHVVRTAGFDLLALKHYAEHNSLASLGKIIAKGKESDVYEALTDTGELLALKFFRLGRTSFRDVRRKRFVDAYDSRSWATKNYQAARSEFRALTRLEGVSEHIPTAVSYNRHTALLQELPGVRLAERPDLSDPEGMLKDIIRAIRRIYAKAGLINADLSEYNVLTDGARFWFIDWPQAVASSHPNAKVLLSRDVGAVLGFFRRVYGLSMDPSESVGYVLGERRMPAVRRARASSRE